MSNEADRTTPAKSEDANRCINILKNGEQCGSGNVTTTLKYRKRPQGQEKTDQEKQSERYCTKCYNKLKATSTESGASVGDSSLETSPDLKEEEVSDDGSRPDATEPHEDDSSPRPAKPRRHSSQYPSLPTPKKHVHSRHKRQGKSGIRWAHIDSDDNGDIDYGLLARLQRENEEPSSSTGISNDVSDDDEQSLMSVRGARSPKTSKRLESKGANHPVSSNALLTKIETLLNLQAAAHTQRISQVKRAIKQVLEQGLGTQRSIQGRGSDFAEIRGMMGEIRGIMEDLPNNSYHREAKKLRDEVKYLRKETQEVRKVLELQQIALHEVNGVMAKEIHQLGVVVANDKQGRADADSNGRSIRAAIDKQYKNIRASQNQSYSSDDEE